MPSLAACLVMVTLHELGHVIGSLAQGNAPVLYSFNLEDHSVTAAGVRGHRRRSQVQHPP